MGVFLGVAIISNTLGVLDIHDTVDVWYKLVSEYYQEIPQS